MKPFVNLFRWFVVSISLAAAPAGLCAVPLITRFTPSAAPAGASVTINGDNFDPSSTNDIVYFGPVRASITSATSTNLVVTVPNGAMYAPITVTAGGLMGCSVQPFEPTFSGNGAAFDAASFAPRLDISLPSGPTRVAVADLNGDGKPDLIVASIYAHTITILQNNSTNGSLDSNSFTVALTIPFVNSAQSPYWITAGDVDGDGKIDIIAPDEAGNRLLIYQNISSGGTLTTNSFAEPVAFATGASPRNIALRDLDGDGRPDLAVANVGDQTVSILKNIGTTGVIDTNSFAPQFLLQAGSQPQDLTIGDIDGDGKPDLAVANYTSPFVSLYRNISATGVLDTNSFEAPFALPAPMYCNSVILGDLDNDGKLDLLTGTAQGNNEVSVYRNTATPGSFSTTSFAPRSDFPAVGWVNTVVVGDLNGDGKLDVGAVNQMNSTFALFQNIGSGSFSSASLASRVDLSSGNDPIGLTIVDLDGDGRPDVIFGNTYDASISIYRNINGTPVAPYITSQPANRTVALGGTATFSVTAVGTAPLCYQWWNSTGIISNATNSTFTLTNVQTNNAGTYFVVVTNLYGSVTSSNAVLTINTNTTTGGLPIILRQPINRTVPAGSTTSFSVLVTGPSPFSYQWSGPAGTIPGATSSTLILSNVQPANAGNYHVRVSNAYGFVNSTNALLTVTGGTNSTPPPSCVPPPLGIAAWWPAEGNGDDVIGGNTAILEDGVAFGAGEVGQAFLLQNPTNAFMHVPASSNLNVGASSGLTMEGWIKVSSVSGLHPIAEWDGEDRFHVGVQMWLNTNPFQSGTLFGALPDTDGGQHTLISADNIVVPNAFQHVAMTYDRSSGIGTLYLNGAVVAQANLGSFVPQTTYDLWIGHRPFAVPDDSTYQTFLGGALDELSIYSRALSSNEIASIYAAGTNGKCREVTSTAPAITHQPTNQTVTAGGIAVFSVTATGTSPLSYQWSGPAGTISNATSSTLILSNVQPANAGSYHVLVSNAFGSTTSSNAVLTVTPGIATIRVVNTSAPSGTSVTVPVTLSANGNENALSFSLNFDPAWLVYSSVDVGSSATDALLLPNISQASNGQIGIALALPSGETFAAGTQEVVLVTFNAPVISSTQAVTSVGFGSQPIAKLLADTLGQSLPANFVNGSVTLAVAALEGDASPVPAGNGSVDLLDWVQVGRFVAGLDTITNGAEFQKVDCAPRNTLGDGKLKVTDWVQAGRYAAGLDPLTTAGGPTGPVSLVAPHAQAGATSRQVTIGSGATVKGMGLTLPINLTAQGDETALAFSLNFDPTVLRYVGTAKGSDVSTAILTVNANQAAAGQVAIVLALPNDGSHFAAGIQELAKVSFVALANTADNSVSFADQPVARSISDANATELDANYLSSSIVINPQPNVNLSISGGASVLTWPTWAGDFTLQAANSLTPPINWTNVPVTLQTNGDHIEITLPRGDQQTFFRLYHP